MNNKIPPFVTDSRTKYYYKRIVAVLTAGEDCDQFIVAQLAAALTNCEKAQKDIDENGFLLVTATATKTSPAVDFLKSQQMAVRNGLQQLKLTPHMRGQLESSETDSDDDFDKFLTKSAG